MTIEIGSRDPLPQLVSGPARRLLPNPSPLTRPFWEACRRGELVVQECDTCSRRFFTPEVACIHCRSTAWHWAPSGGSGTVYTFSVVHRPPGPGFDVPFVLAAIDLDDGWTMMTNIVDCPADAVVIGMRVAVRFVAVSEEISLPCFAPA